ncbi:MAG TPA: lactate utilization protein [Verrucomicrobiae bacterium]|nr:lactate utilization protein [Verrucomicrobiae bacterium]
MNERESILARIREALRVQAPRAGHADGQTGESPGLPDAAAMRRWLPAGGETLDEQLALFAKNATDLKAEFHLLQTPQELGSRVRALRDTEGWSKVATHRGDLTDLVCQELNLPVCHTDTSYDPAELESCSVGITQCDALVAQTGSVLLSSRSAGGRALSVLPPHHLVLARREQLLRDLPAALELLKRTYAPTYPSFISFITGPSRTGDIERILVLGAHGPKKLTIVCV